ncbi:MAG: hypothetical protein GY862_28250 [Gammaproteobacteria bacterium]|nr:hypothetical protein [Gammaproteobacteria bacterium]
MRQQELIEQMREQELIEKIKRELPGLLEEDADFREWCIELSRKQFGWPPRIDADESNLGGNPSQPLDFP